MRPIRLTLTGAYYGQNVELRIGGNTAWFTNGVLELPVAPAGAWDGLLRYCMRSYQAYPEGTQELRELQARDRAWSEEYRDRCARFGVDPVVRAGMPDPFCKHAKALAEQEKQHGQRPIQTSTQPGAASPPPGQVQSHGSGPGKGQAEYGSGPAPDQAGDPGRSPDRSIESSPSPTAGRDGNPPAVAPAGNQPNPRGPSADLIRKAVLGLDQDNPTHWTKDGLPAVAAVSRAAKIGGLSRKEITHAMATVGA